MRRTVAIEDCLIFEAFEQWVAEVFEKQSLDQLVHRASAAAVREGDVCVGELCFRLRARSTRWKSGEGEKAIGHFSSGLTLQHCSCIARFL